MIKTISLTDIAETGYSTWREFYFKRRSSSTINSKTTYDYLNPTDKNATITLELPFHILEGLVLGESKTLLQAIGFKSFAELLEKGLANLSLSNGTFQFDVIVQNKNDVFLYRQVSLAFYEVEELARIEKKERRYSYYEEIKNPQIN